MTYVDTVFLSSRMVAVSVLKRESKETVYGRSSRSVDSVHFSGKSNNRVPDPGNPGKMISRGALYARLRWRKTPEQRESVDTVTGNASGASVSGSQPAGVPVETVVPLDPFALEELPPVSAPPSPFSTGELPEESPFVAEPSSPFSTGDPPEGCRPFEDSFFRREYGDGSGPAGLV